MSLFTLLSSAFPEYELKPWELTVVTRGYWSGEDSLVNQLQILQWWLDNHHLTPKEMVEQLETHQFGLWKELKAAKLRKIQLRAMLRLLDSSIPTENTYVGKKTRRKEKAKLTCQICGRKFIKLGNHMRFQHELTGGKQIAESRLALSVDQMQTVGEIALQYRLSFQSLTSAANTGRFPAQKTGHQWLIDIHTPQFQAWIIARKRGEIEGYITTEKAIELLKAKGFTVPSYTLHKACRIGEITRINTNPTNPKQGVFLIEKASLEEWVPFSAR